MRIYKVISALMFFITSIASYAKYIDGDYPSYYGPAKTVYYGTIQFPMNLRTLPAIRIYYKGRRISGETNNDTKKASFNIVDENPQNSFHLLFTEHLQFETEQSEQGGQSNVIKYLKVPENSHYKFYTLSLANNNPFLEEAAENVSNKMRWHIRKHGKAALHNGIIPDNTIIVCLDPDYVEKVEGGSTTTLPTIKIRSDIVTFVGSEEKIHEKSDELQLSLVMDCDAIHAAVQQEIRPKFERKMIVALTT